MPRINMSRARVQNVLAEEALCDMYILVTSVQDPAHGQWLHLLSRIAVLQKWWCSRLGYINTRADEQGAWADLSGFVDKLGGRLIGKFSPTGTHYQICDFDELRCHNPGDVVSERLAFLDISKSHPRTPQCALQQGTSQGRNTASLLLSAIFSVGKSLCASRFIWPFPFFNQSIGVCGRIQTISINTTYECRALWHLRPLTASGSSSMNLSIRHSAPPDHTSWLYATKFEVQIHCCNREGSGGSYPLRYHSYCSVLFFAALRSTFGASLLSRRWCRHCEG